MIEIKITDDIKHKAMQKAEEMGTLNNSIMKGAGNLAGFIGEFIVADIFNGEIVNTYDYDIVGEDGTTIEVKTKQTKVKPLPHYDCSIAAYNTKQKCHTYAFVRVNYNLTTAWFLGYLTKKEYFEKARFLRKGDIDPANNFTVRADCYNVSIKELTQ